VVEAVTQRAHDAPSSGKQVEVESGHKPDDFSTQNLFTSSQDGAPEPDKPRLFKPAEDNVSHFMEGQDFQSDISIPSDGQRHAATPLFLPDPDDSHDPLPDIQGDSSGVLPTGLARLDSDNVIEIDDEWGTGDDELVRANVDEVGDVFELTDDEVEEVQKPEDESPAASGENTDQCPFCGITLTNFSSLVSSPTRFSFVLTHRFCYQDMQSHITTCCDSFSTAAPSPIPLFLPENSPTPPPPSEGKGSVGRNAYSILMSSNKENDAWKEAETVEDRGFRPTKANGGRRKAPFYKVLQGMPIAVDAFRYGEIPGVTSYFLTCVFIPFTTMLENI
jgi:hypothetical protein